jgi:hypothetical protein
LTHLPIALPAGLFPLFHPPNSPRLITETLRPLQLVIHRFQQLWSDKDYASTFSVGKDSSRYLETSRRPLGISHFLLPLLRRTQNLALAPPRNLTQPTFPGNNFETFNPRFFLHPSDQKEQERERQRIHHPTPCAPVSSFLSAFPDSDSEWPLQESGQIITYHPFLSPTSAHLSYIRFLSFSSPVSLDHTITSNSHTTPQFRLAYRLAC